MRNKQQYEELRTLISHSQQWVDRSEAEMSEGFEV